MSRFSKSLQRAVLGAVAVIVAAPLVYAAPVAAVEGGAPAPAGA